MVSHEVRDTATFVVLTTTLWLLARRFSSNSWMLWAVLVGVGVVVPTLVNEVMNR